MFKTRYVNKLLTTNRHTLLPFGGEILNLKYLRERFLIKILGKRITYTVTSTHGYDDVSVQSGLVYAAGRARANRVDVYDSSTWRRLRQIPTPCCSTEAYSDHTLHVSDDRIRFCCSKKAKLHVLSHSGELLQTHGRSVKEASEDDIIGRNASGELVYGPGVLYGPRLCQVDADRSALVADTHNDRLQLMRADGTWSVVDLDRNVVNPKGAVWCNASLYVANDNVIVRFSAL